MVLNVICLSYHKSFCPAHAELVGVFTSGGVCGAQDPWKACSWECMELYDTVDCLPLLHFCVMPLFLVGWCLLESLQPGLTLCYFAHTVSYEGCKKGFLYCWLRTQLFLTFI